MKKLFLLPFILLVLIACQEQGNEDQNNKVENNAETTEEVVENEAIEEVIDYGLYDDVIAEYSEIEQMTLEEMEEADFTYVKEGALYYFYEGLLYDGISATYHDLNGDGIDELIISLSLKEKYGSYVVIDIYTIKDQELLALIDDRLSVGGMTKRSMYLLTDKGELILVSSNAQGEGFGTIYELVEAGDSFIEAYNVTVDGGDFAEIEKALENTLDFEEFAWEDILTKADKYINQGDFSALNGKWKTKKYEGEVIFNSEEKKLYFSEDARLDIVYHEPDPSQDEIPIYFGLQEEDGVGGASLSYYPAGSEIHSMDGIVPTDTDKDRFVITQAPDINEDEVYYRVSDLEK